MLKVTSQNLFSVSKEDHTEETAKELDEQGAISTADAEEVVAPITPDADTAEAGDDIGQATPKEEIGADDKADITQTEDELPLDGAVTVDTAVTTTTDGDEQSSEMTDLLQEGADAASAKDAIVQEATAEVTGGDAGAETDVNGNPVTPEQAAVNAEEQATDNEVEEEVEDEAAAKNIHQEAAEADENSDEELGEAINDSSETGDDLGADNVAEDLGDATTDAGEPGTDDMGDLSGDVDAGDDTPLEGAEELADDAAGDSTGDPTDTGSDGDAPAIDTSGDTTGDDLGGSETGDDVVADAVPAEGDDIPLEGTGEETTEEVAETTDVAEEVEQQNEAADVTAEAASADADQTAFIANDTPEQEGDIPTVDDTVTGAEETQTESTDSNDVSEFGTPNEGEEVVAEAGDSEAVVNDETTQPTQTEEVAEPPLADDDTPLDGAEELGVNAEEDLTAPGKDMGDSDGTAATVEESTTDETADDLQDGMDDVAASTAEVDEDAGTTPAEAAEETVPESETEVVEETSEVVEEAPAVDVESGEIEETEEPADFDAGEVEIKDVDTTTTDADVEEAMADAAEVGEWGDKEEKDADIGDKTIEELQKEKEALENFRVLLEDGIANESYNPGLLAFMNGMAEPIRKRLAALDSHFDTPIASKVALEAYTSADMDLAYRATLESFQGMISRMATISTGIAHKIEKWWSRGLVDKVTSRADALDKQIDLCLIQLKDADYSTKELSGIRGYLSTDESNLVKAVGEDLKLITEISIKGIKASETLQGNVIKGVNDIISGTAEGIEKALDGIANLSGTKAQFPSAAFTSGLLGGYKLEIRAAAGGSRTEKIEALGHTGIPVGTKATKASDGSSYTLSKGDIVNLLKFAKAYVAVARKLANTTGDRAIELSTRVRTTRNRALPVAADTRIRGDEQGVDAAATTMKLLAQAHLDLYKFITKHCVEVADACCSVAKKAIK